MTDGHMSEKSLESILRENRSFVAPATFAAVAHPNTAELAALHAEAQRDPAAFWAGQARTQLQWQQPFTQTLDESAAPNYRWFTDGKLNVSFNCLDVHLAERRDHVALLFEAEDGSVRRLTYGQLHAEVCRFANGLLALGARCPWCLKPSLPCTPAHASVPCTRWYSAASRRFPCAIASAMPAHVSSSRQMAASAAAS
jgi:hypothetical protein